MTLEAGAVVPATDEKITKKESSLFVLYLKQKRPPPAEIRRLHPKITDVRIPRSKSAKFCILEFESPEAARAAKHDLHSRNSEISVRLRRQENTPNLEAAVKRRERKLKRKLEASKGKDDTATTEESGKKVKTSKSLRTRGKKTSTKKAAPLSASPAKILKKKTKKDTKTPKQDSAEDVQDLPSGDACCLIVKGLPLLASQQVLQSLFPQSTNIQIGTKKVNGRRVGLVRFTTEEEAAKAMASSSGVSVNGEALTVENCLPSP